MSRYKVSYSRCKKSTFSGKVNKNQLVPGRLYFVKDTGQIIRADSENTYEDYSTKVHVVDDWPSTFIEDHIYLKKLLGENNPVRAKIMNNGVIYEIESSGGGGGSGDISELAADVERLKQEVANIKTDIASLQEDMEDVKDRLTWKS